MYIFLHIRICVFFSFIGCSYTRVRLVLAWTFCVLPFRFCSPPPPPIQLYVHIDFVQGTIRKGVPT